MQRAIADVAGSSIVLLLRSLWLYSCAAGYQEEADGGKAMLSEFEDIALREFFEPLGHPQLFGSGIELEGSAHVLPSSFDVTAIATAAVSATSLIALELARLRGIGDRDETLRAPIAREHAVASFHGERLLKLQYGAEPKLWSPISGNYKTQDGWIRIHANYTSHRNAACKALGFDTCPRDADTVAHIVAREQAVALESRIVGAGGAAAALHTAEEWSSHPVGRAVAAEPLVFREPVSPTANEQVAQHGPLPLSGVRVLDLTRVIAGPVATRCLAFHGADVLHVDPPAFEEMPALIPETTAGKSILVLDIASEPAHFRELLKQTDILVVGLRADALANLGFTEKRLREIQPNLIIVRLNAYGWSKQNPWRSRRGFDSLVQLSTGIAYEEGKGGLPGKLPVQALDYATGFFAAASAMHGYAQRVKGKGAATYRLSLARTAHLLKQLKTSTCTNQNPVNQPDFNGFMEEAESTQGSITRVKHPGAILKLPYRSLGPALHLTSGSLPWALRH